MNRRKLIYKYCREFLSFCFFFFFFIEGHGSTGSLKTHGAFPVAITMMEKINMSRGSMKTLVCKDLE